MPIFYSAISRGQTVLVSHASGCGPLAHVCDLVRQQLQPDEFMMTFVHGDHLISCICEANINYMCISDIDFDRNRAYLFLGEIKDKFVEAHGSHAIYATVNELNAAFSPVMSAKQTYFNKPTDKISHVQGQVDDCREIMVKAIDSLVNRGVMLERLIDQTADLEESSASFGLTSRRLARQMWCTNIRMIVILCVLLLAIVGVVVAIVLTGKSS